MLISFTVSNFRSFDKEERFSMVAGKARNFSERTNRISSANVKLIKFKAVYGANASGKSNLVRAIDFMQHAMLHGIPANAAMDYCRVSDNNAERPSTFAVEVVLNNIRYIYGFEAVLNSGLFTKEWMYEVRRQHCRTIFYRDVRKGTYDVASYMEDSQLADRLSFYADDIKNDGSILFLRVMNKNKDALYDTYPILAPYRTVYRWFRFKLSVNYPDEPITQYTYFFDSEGSATAEELLARFDTGISKVQVCDEPTEKLIAQFPKRLWSDLVESLTEQKRRYEEQHQERIPAIILRMQEDHSMYIFELIEEEVRCKTLKFQHKHGQSLFSLKEESDGTIRLLDLLEVLLANNSDMVYVIDEVSRCLHPLLTKKFIGDFLALAAERNIQLIVTTHEADLMDLDLLRQDEIGFVGKRDEDGTSKIFGLDEFGARFDKRIRKAYLDGEYGGIPNLSNGKLVPHM